MSQSRSFSLTLSMLFLLTLISASFAITTPVSAATILVNSFADNMTNDGLCTLREAIIAANTDSAYRGCPAGNGEDTIALPKGTYTLNSQLPNITSQIIINGSGASSTIIQASACNPIEKPEGCTPANYRVFSVDSGSSLHIDKLTIRHGYAENSGGGIQNLGTLIVMDSILSGNLGASGGAVLNSGFTGIVRSVFSNNMADSSQGGGSGGGIANSGGTVLVDRSKFEDNYASYGGGGIANYNGAVAVTNTTLTNNRARYGGGILNASTSSPNTLNIVSSTLSENIAFNDGGGIFGYYSEGDIKVTNSTFSGNKANIGGGIRAGDKTTLYLESSTFTQNSANQYGGVFTSGILNFSNTIIANSFIGLDCYVARADGRSIGTNMHNLVGDGSCSVGGINFLSGDPKLGPLANNGGPTQTHALLADSPAIDAAFCDLSPAVDQRGEPRPSGSACDIGAFEFSPEPIISMAITLEEPVIGDEPDTEADIVSNPMGAIAAPTANVTWDPPHAAFAYNQAYAITVVLTVADGFEYLDGSTMVSVNDQSPDSVTFNDIESTLTVVYTFDALIKDEISFIYLPLITR
jgi:CSLREA domain-containing protein